jgi:hypothetical protein
MVKTSDIIDTPDAPPGSWDHTDLTNNATEDTLGQMKGEIIDANTLGSAMMIYSPEETWVMRADGSDNVYSYDFLFSKGAINTNCSVEVDGVHYVFGANDLWMHDGNTPTSISDQRVREFVFSTMNRSLSPRFFVKYNAVLKEVQFFYYSGDAHVEFNGGDVEGCNRVAVYTPANGKWTFDDAPNIFGGALGNVANLTDWVDVPGTWGGSGGSWLDLDDGFKTVNVYVGAASAVHDLDDMLYAQDLFGEGSIVTAPVAETANPGAYLERTGIDLDEIDVDLRDYKHVTAIYPQGRVDPDGEALEFSFGVVDYAGQTPEYEDYQTFDGDAVYEIDFTSGGRYLSYRIRYEDYRTFRLSGFDIDVVMTGGI